MEIQFCAWAIEEGKSTGEKGHGQENILMIHFVKRSKSIANFSLNLNFQIFLLSSNIQIFSFQPLFFKTSARIKNIFFSFQYFNASSNDFSGVKEMQNSVYF